jgi:hypothetical protein
LNLLTYQNVYLKDAVIDRILKVESKINIIKGSFEYSGKQSKLLKVHVQGLEHELITLCDIKQKLEQEIYNSAHNI